MAIRVALAGNPNVGKTSLFNAITGERQHVGNWPGITVERREGAREHAGHRLELVDLPGTYGLTASSPDELVARDHVLGARPDVVLQVVDATSLERNLYLTTELMTLEARLVIALNMYDVVRDRGDRLDVARLEALLEVPVVPTSAVDGEGIDALLDAVVREATRGEHHHHTVGFGTDLEPRLAALRDVLAGDPSLASAVPLRWLAVKLMEGDEAALDRLGGSPAREAALGLLAGEDVEANAVEMAGKRYELVDGVVGQVLARADVGPTPTDMLDRVLTHRWLGIPIFLALMWGAFELTFVVSIPLTTLLSRGFEALGGWAAAELRPEWLGSLVGDGIVPGVGFVLSFVPPIFILFLLLALMEDSGYMARAAFNMDRLMAKVGLHGKSFVPMLMGFGCNVPAILACRCIEDRTDRLVTILVNPFMQCGARLPVYVLIAGALFGARAGTAIFAIYLLGIVAAIGTARLLRWALAHREQTPFIMEMPRYSMPTLAGCARHTWDRGALYLRKAGTVILLGAVLVWALASLPWGVEYASEDSLAGALGRALEPALRPLGLDWRFGIALAFGLVGKEIIAGTLAVLFGGGEGGESLYERLSSPEGGLSPASALGLMAFTAVYMPCIATMAAIRRETGSWRWTAFALLYGLGLAWALAFAINQLGSAMGYG